MLSARGDNNTTVSFVIPSLNEVETIGGTLDSIPVNKLERMGFNTESIVVDGGSDDGTREQARRNGTKVILEKKGGYGYAYQLGFKHAKGDIIVTGDADDTYPFEIAPKLIQIMQKHDLDLIVTNRLINENLKAFSPVNLVGNKLLSILTRLLFNLHITDSQSGMWVFKKDLLDNLSFRGMGMEFSVEFKIETLKKADKFVELPIKYKVRETGKSKVRWHTTGVKVGFFLIKKRLLSLFDPLLSLFDVGNHK